MSEGTSEQGGRGGRPAAGRPRRRARHAIVWLVALGSVAAVAWGFHLATRLPPPRAEKPVYGTFTQIADKRSAPAAIRNTLAFAPLDSSWEFGDLAEVMGGGLHEYVGSKRVPGTFVLVPGRNGSTDVTWELPCRAQTLLTDARGVAVIRVNISRDGSQLQPLNENARAITEQQS